MIALTDQQLQDFQEALAWKTGEELPDSRVLGVPGKRGKLTAATLDARVRWVLEHLQPASKTVLEFGSCEGIHTVQLAGVCKQVVGLEVRPRNIACALVRLFVHGVHNARLVIKDVREVDASLGTFDIVFHVGVLYHLTDPVAHLARVAALAPDLLLDTHYANAELAWKPETIMSGKRCYAGRQYREGDWADAFSGVEPTACWLMRDDLLRVLGDVGYDRVEVLKDRVERNGPRITILARQTRAFARREMPAEPSGVERQLLANAVEAARQRREINALRCHNESLQTELTALRRSWTWRLGRLAVGPLHQVRKALRKVRTAAD